MRPVDTSSATMRPVRSRTRWASWLAVIQPAGDSISTVSLSMPCSDHGAPPAISGPPTLAEHRDQVGPITATGHGFTLPNEMGEMPQNIVFATARDPKTIEQMIASTDRGVLVTRLWYIREVEPFEKMLTGMTRDGTFLVENGRVAGGVRNFRFNESLIHMLSNVEAMSVPARSSGEESFDMVVPAMKIKDFNFTEVTKF